MQQDLSSKHLEPKARAERLIANVPRGINLLKRKVAEVMQPCPDPISMTATLNEATERMSAQSLNWLPVDGPTGPVGVVSAGDIVRRAAFQNHSSYNTQVSEIMTLGVVCCKSTDSALTALQLMHEYHVYQIGVLDEDNRLAAVTSVFDLVALILAVEGVEE